MWLRILFFLGAAAALWLGVQWFEGQAEARGFERGERSMKGKWDAANELQRLADDKARAEREARERAITEQQEKARHEQVQREQGLRAAADRLRAERDSLRDELADARQQLPTASCSSVREHAATLNAVFGACTAALEGMAGAAAGHASDSLMYQQAWPR